MGIMTPLESIETLKSIWWAGVNDVNGYRCTHNFFRYSTIDKPTLILSVGKAAEQMYLAAAEYFGSDIPYFVATKYGHILQLNGPNTLCAGHPTPDENSIKAGQELLNRVKSSVAGDHLLFLVSGGASAIAELPEVPATLNDIILKNNQMLSSGMTISEINRRRTKYSQIKGGKLLSHFKGESILTLGLSDVEGNDIAVIGSGIGLLEKPCGPDYRYEIVGSNKTARDGAERAAIDAGFEVRENCEYLYQDVYTAAKGIADKLKSSPGGVWIFGGEPTISLPPQHGKGGRNQSLALALAREVAGLKNVRVLAAGSDGTDGPTNAAGAIVDGTTWKSAPGAEKALQTADAWTWLNREGCLFITGPTGTNVMDLVIACRY